MSAIQTIREHLEAIADMQSRTRNGAASRFRFVGLEDLVLKWGREFSLAPYPEGLWRGKKRECFHNAFRLASEADLFYVEGYALSIIPMLHAWCIDADGRVVDPTWDPDENMAYLGIPLKWDYVIDILVSRGYYGVLDNWEQGFPLLTGDDDISDVVVPWPEGQKES